ncbi:hypothetical protein R69746_04898 [Paraburkholderia aspalathi]|nr:hypothetical protein R69746_04898 [Paraburkholderia aspalathi]
MTNSPLPSSDTAADSPTEGASEIHATSLEHLEEALPETQHEARLWRDDGWTARVIKNEDDRRHDQGRRSGTGACRPVDDGP